MKQRHWLIAYDICDPKRLRHVEKIVSRYGIRVQRSVFESDVDEALIERLRQRLAGIIAVAAPSSGDVSPGDRVVIFPLCERDWQKVERYGVVMAHPYISGSCVVL
jgi:CRISPR-associated protein Cas2